jgi:hypothetical protein
VSDALSTALCEIKYNSSTRKKAEVMLVLMLHEAATRRTIELGGGFILPDAMTRFTGSSYSLEHVVSQTPWSGEAKGKGKGKVNQQPELAWYAEEAKYERDLIPDCDELYNLILLPKGDNSQLSNAPACVKISKYAERARVHDQQPAGGTERGARGRRPATSPQREATSWPLG